LSKSVNNNVLYVHKDLSTRMTSRCERRCSVQRTSWGRRKSQRSCTVKV